MSNPLIPRITLAICLLAAGLQIAFDSTKRMEFREQPPRPTVRMRGFRPVFAGMVMGVYAVCGLTAWCWRTEPHESRVTLITCAVIAGVGIYVFGSGWYQSQRRPASVSWQDLGEFFVFLQLLAAAGLSANLKVRWDRRMRSKEKGD